MEKRMGARIDPCGTPQESWAGKEEKLPSLTEKLLLDTIYSKPTKNSSLDAHKIF